MHVLPSLGFVGLYLLFGIAISTCLISIRTASNPDTRSLEVLARMFRVLFWGLGGVSVLLVTLLIGGDYSVAYVALNTDSSQSLIYKVAAFWSGDSGSMLLWVVLLAGFSRRTLRRLRGVADSYVPVVGAVLSALISALLLVLVFADNPFSPVSGSVNLADGRGMNPLLENLGMIIHPLGLYIGYAGFSIPFALAVANLYSPDPGNDFWITFTRRWTLFSWFFLSLGIFAGGLWAYTELGWGGVWMWDPVENASLLPWLASTAFLHSVMIQERKNMLRIWNVALIFLTYLSTIFGTFLVRSGLLTSVHAFGDARVGSILLLVLLSGTLFCGHLIVTRARALGESSPGFESVVSKESSFLLNNLVLIGILFAVFLGTLFPVISEALTGERVSVGRPYFDTVVGPLFLVLLILMGVCPLLAWQRASWTRLVKSLVLPVLAGVIGAAALGAELHAALSTSVFFGLVCFVAVSHLGDFVRAVRNRVKLRRVGVFRAGAAAFSRNTRRFGGYLVHIGVVLLGFGMVGYSMFGERTTVTLSPGESLEFAGYSIVFESLDSRRGDGETAAFARLRVTDPGGHEFPLRPERVFHEKWPDMPTTEVGIRGTFGEDFYSVLGSWETDGRVTMQFKVLPLVAWIWIGSLVMLVGVVFAFFHPRNAVVPKYRHGLVS